MPGGAAADYSNGFVANLGALPPCAWALRGRAAMRPRPAGRGRGARGHEGRVCRHAARYNGGVAAPELPLLEFADAGAWELWLHEHNADAHGVWLKFAKKGSGATTVDYPQALTVALCYGWIDGQVGRLDARFYRQRFTPRRPRSKWSQINVEKATELIAQGRMQPPGLAQVEAAKADGRWADAYPSQSRATLPDDLHRALDEHPAAGRFFATLKGTDRYAFLYRLHQIKRPEARDARIAEYIELLSDGRTLS